MNKFIFKNKLLATTVICAISVCANTVKAEEIDILSILNNSTTKSPNISWEKVDTAGTDTIQIGDEYFKYTWTEINPNRLLYAELLPFVGIYSALTVLAHTEIAQIAVVAKSLFFNINLFIIFFLIIVATYMKYYAHKPTFLCNIKMYIINSFLQNCFFLFFK